MIHLAKSLLGASAFLAGVVVDEKTFIPLGTAVFVFTAVWWLGRKLQALEDGQQHLNREIRGLPCKLCRNYAPRDEEEERGD